MNTKFVNLFENFFASEQASGAVLFICTLSSIMIANSPLGQRYLDFWHLKIGFEHGVVHLKYSVESWINNGFMTVFFLMIGLEIKRELYIGELSNLKNASLPIFAALGGMLTPALLHFFFNRGMLTQAGFGIPMATDIAFALGALSLLGNKVPVSLRVFLAALAIIDDLGAIVVIALFYGAELSITYLALALGIFMALVIFNRLGLKRLSLYLIPGLIMWYCMSASGVHATLTGVLLAFAIPFTRGDGDAPSYKLQYLLHKPVAFIILPMFALANTSIVLTGNWVQGLASPNSLGIFAGLFIGKPLGIVLFSFLAVKSGLSRLPADISWKHMMGAGCLGGIGFTMSIFITLLAFDNPEFILSSKLAILFTSFLAATTGYLILNKQTF